MIVALLLLALGVSLVANWRLLLAVLSLNAEVWNQQEFKFAYRDMYDLERDRG